MGAHNTEIARTMPVSVAHQQDLNFMIRILSIFLVAALLGACGQAGDLYLPVASAEQAKTAEVAGVPVDEGADEDDEKEDKSNSGKLTHEDTM